MAQVEVRIFSELDRTDRYNLIDNVSGIVSAVHYNNPSPAPGDITRVVPLLDMAASDSSAAYELEISEGSDNWPRDSAGDMLLHDPMKLALEARARSVGIMLAQILPRLDNNIFEVNGRATGWAAYSSETGLVVPSLPGKE